MVQQLSLFDDELTIERFADILCKEFNRVPSVWSGTFEVKDVNLEKWEHIDDPNKVLSITLKPTLGDNYLINFKGDNESQRNIYNACCFSPIISRLGKDNDFSVCITPWSIYIYYHKYERKNLSWIMN